MTETAATTFRPLEIDEPEGRLIAYEVGGKVTAEQAEPLFARIKKAASEGRKLRLYYELHGLPSTEGSVVVEKFKNLGTILKTIERVAIVGDQGWLSVYTAVADPITKMEIQSFKTDQREAARAWIQE